MLCAERVPPEESLNLLQRSVCILPETRTVGVLSQRECTRLVSAISAIDLTRQCHSQGQDKSATAAPELYQEWKGSPLPFLCTAAASYRQPDP